MSDTGHNMPWKFLSDNAVQTDEQDKFGIHSAYAKVLYHIARTCTTPFTIALYSSWGTGKTSISNLVRQLAAQDKDICYVYLDVWKYSSEPLKRWVLIETERSLTEQNALTDYKFGGRSLQSHLEFEESWEDRDKLTINFKAIRGLSVAIIALIGAFLAFLFLTPPTSPHLHILTVLVGFLAAGGVAVALLESVLKELFKALSGLVFERKVKHVSAKPAFSSEKFSEIFRDMVHYATKPTADTARKILFTFDNLDRCSEEIAVETIGVIKTYLDEPGCVYIIPCDEAALMKHITKSYTAQSNVDDARSYAKEFLNKFFQTTLRLPIAPEFDIETFLDEQLALAGMTDLPADARDVLVLGYLGQTPRQIKRVLNDLIAYRSLAVQAEKDRLLESGALTSDLSLLTKMSVISVEWPDFLNMLADDPELWADLMDKISTGQEIDEKEIRPGLVSFLRATRHVSYEADIRPFIYLKRVAYERNVALAKAVQNNLRKGEAKEFLELLGQTKSPSEQEEIIRIATDLARAWLDASSPRDVFLKNSGSVLLKASNKYPGNRLLELTVSDLLERFSATTKPVDLAEVISLSDLFDFSPSVQTGQKEQCLAKLADLFEPSVAFGKNHLQYWQQFLAHDQQLPPEIRSKLSAYIEARYSKNEADALPMLYAAAQSQTDTTWLVAPTVLAAIAGKITFANDESDVRRLEVLVRFQSRMDGVAKTSVTTALTTTLQGSRTRALDTQASSAIGFLKRIDTAILNQNDLKSVADTLIEQVGAHAPLGEKAPWLAPLIIMRKNLSPPLQSAVDSLYRNLLLDPTDINALLQLLTGLTPAVCSHIPAIPENVIAIHDQAAKVEARFTLAQAPAHREKILDCFPSGSLLDNLKLFDEARTWDLVLFSKIVTRGKKEKLTDERLRKQLAQFVGQFIKGKSTKHSAALDNLLDLSKTVPDLFDEHLARELSQCCIEVLGANVDKYFASLRYLSTRLSTKDRLWLADELVDTILKPRQPQWIQVLQRMVEDLAKDTTLSADAELVEKLNDYAFEAARVSPPEATGILVNLLPHLRLGYLEQKLDEAQDRLLGLEGTGPSASKMQPYLALLAAANSRYRQSLPEKLVTFCIRMLGTAKTDEEKKIVLDFLRDSDLADVNQSIAERIKELASTEGPAGDAARLILQGPQPASEEPPAPRDKE